MSLDSLALRPRYQRSGKVRWGRLLLLLPIPLVVAAVMAVTLCWGFNRGHYYSIITPVLACLPLIGAACVLIRWSHCRNLTLAAVLGVLFGLQMYLGYFHVHFVAAAGLGAIHRVDLLPRFIQWRMQTDVQIDPEQPQQQQPRQPRVWDNWFHFVVELVAVTAILAAVSSATATRAYCEHCGHWMRQGVHVAPLGWAQQIAAHLAAGRLQELPVVERIMPTSGGSSCVKVEACRHAGKNEECCAYLTLQDNIAGGHFKANKTTKYLSGGQITHEELGWLSLKLAGLASLVPPGFAATAAAVMQATPSSPAETTGLVQLPREAAIVESLPGRHAEQVYTTMNNAIAFGLCLLPITSVLVGIGLLLLAWSLAPAKGADMTGVAASLSCVAVGVVLLLFGLVMCYINIDYFGLQYGLWLTKSEIAMRPDAIVNPEDPHAMWAEIIPRERWAKLSIDKASDGGFLLVDEGKRQLLFEGIKQRYRIPAEAIIDCRSELMQDDTGHFGQKLTVLQVNVAPSSREGAETSVRELPVHLGVMNFGHYSFALRRRWADELRDRIHRLRSGS